MKGVDLATVTMAIVMADFHWIHAMWPKISEGVLHPRRQVKAE